MIDKNILEQCVKDSISYSEILRKLRSLNRGIRLTSLKDAICFYNIDISNLKGCSWAKGLNKDNSSIFRRLSEDNIIANEAYLCRDTSLTTESLRKLLDKFGIKVECSECKITKFYNSKPITLQIDHINGDRYDNRIENLRYLCPTCHSQQVTSYNTLKRYSNFRKLKKRRMDNIS